MKPVFTLYACLLLPLALVACAAEGPFPSLAQREVERQPLGEPVRVIPVVANDPALQGALGELLRLARAADRDFQAAIQSATSASRSAGAPGSDSWVAAQEQISRAEAARAGTTRALGDLDKPALERSNVPTGPADQASLRNAVDEIQGLADDQSAQLDRLKGLIAR